MAENNEFIREVNEDYRRDKIAQIWRRYSGVIIALAILVVAGVGGWRYWQNDQRIAAEAASRAVRRGQPLARDGKVAEADKVFDALDAQGPAGYRLLAQFRSAAETAKRDPAAGAAEFDKISDDTALGDGLRDLARLRAALLRLDVPDPAPALASLQSLAAGHAVPLHRPRDAGPDCAEEAASTTRPAAGSTSSSATPRRRRTCASASRSTSPSSPAVRDGDRGQARARRSTAADHRWHRPSVRTPCKDSARTGLAPGSRFGHAAVRDPVPLCDRDGGRSSSMIRRTRTNPWNCRPSRSSDGRTSANRPCSTASSGKKLALVDDRPGVTRDRREGDVAFGGLNFRIIDTAGLEEADAATLPGRMRMQTEAAILEADVVLFVIDARAGILPADQPFAELVRRAGCTVILIANKAEGGAGMAGAYEAFPSALAIRSRSRPSTARASASCTRRSRTPCRSPTRTRRRRRPARQAAQGRHRRPAQRRQVDADQPHARRGTPARRPRGRHHPRFDLARLGVARAPDQAPRHRRHAPPRPDRGQAGKARGLGRPARRALRRGGRGAARRHDPVREAGPHHRRPRRERGPCRW